MNMNVKYIKMCGAVPVVLKAYNMCDTVVWCQACRLEDCSVLVQYSEHYTWRMWHVLGEGHLA
jgi:hypothetical protein